LPRIGAGRAGPLRILTACCSSFYRGSSGLRFDAAVFDGGTESAHDALTQIKLIMIRHKTRHLRVYELFAEQLIGRHRGEGPKLLWGEL
jgi:hypothetical protein